MPAASRRSAWPNRSTSALSKDERNRIQGEAEQAMRALLEAAGLKPGQLCVIGCSTSEVAGRRIGTGGSLEVGEALWAGIVPPLREAGVYPVAQCCEHLNRALVLEAEAAERYGLDAVTVQPVPEAGGAWAATAWAKLREPVVVESVRAHAGLDIGHTLIGMHLRPVAVPVRLPLAQIGQAPLVAARTRPKLIGGARAVYPDGSKR